MNKSACGSCERGWKGEMVIRDAHRERIGQKIMQEEDQGRRNGAESPSGLTKSVNLL